jgi:RNA 2',3'-cyclic 3'-phosphodiesterase
VRLFFAIWPPPASAAALEQWARGCQGRVVPAPKIHLTLAFLGQTDPAPASSAARRVRGTAHELPLEQAGYWRHNQILWAGPHKTPQALLELVTQLHSNLRKEGFVLEERPFAAHVTLLRKASQPRASPDLPLVEWPVGEFVLVRSSVSSRGSSYDVIEHFPLNLAG